MSQLGVEGWNGVFTLVIRIVFFYLVVWFLYFCCSFLHILLKKQWFFFTAAQKRSDKVMKNSHEDDLYPFKAVMEDFFSRGLYSLIQSYGLFSNLSYWDSISGMPIPKMMFILKNGDENIYPGLIKMLAVDCSMTRALKTHEVNFFSSNGSHFNFKTSTSDIYM